MAESTLVGTTQFTDIRKEVSYELGFGRTSVPAAGTDNGDYIDVIVLRGLRQFYWHPIAPEVQGVQAQHLWSFLKPAATIVAFAETTTAAATVITTTITDAAGPFHPAMAGATITADTNETEYTIVSVTSATAVVVDSDASADNGDTFTVSANGDNRLPDDWGGIVSPFVYDTNQGQPPISLYGESLVRDNRSLRASTGRPRIGAIVPNSVDGTAGQRFTLMLHPTPDTDYTLHYRYSVLPDKLVVSTAEFPYGGAAHGQTIMASCLSAAETDVEKRRGVRWADFVTLLAASINQDQKALAAMTLGPNTSGGGGGGSFQELREDIRRGSGGAFSYHGFRATYIGGVGTIIL